MNGFLISTTMNKEYKAFKEFSSQMNFFVNTEKQELNNFTDFTSSLADELRNLKIQENFTLMEKYKSILIVRNKCKSLPSDLFLRLRTENSSFYDIKRIVPLDFITKFDEVAIAAFIQKNQFNGTFKIQFEGRLCPDELRTDLFKIIIPLINNKVDLKTPEYVIAIQAFKGLIGLTVMKNDSKNFNFSFFAHPNDNCLESHDKIDELKRKES